MSDSNNMININTSEVNTTTANNNDNLHSPSLGMCAVNFFGNQQDMVKHCLILWFLFYFHNLFKVEKHKVIHMIVFTVPVGFTDFLFFKKKKSNGSLLIKVKETCF